MKKFVCVLLLVATCLVFTACEVSNVELANSLEGNLTRLVYSVGYLDSIQQSELESLVTGSSFGYFGGSSFAGGSATNGNLNGASLTGLSTSANYTRGNGGYSAYKNGGFRSNIYNSESAQTNLGASGTSINMGNMGAGVSGSLGEMGANTGNAEASVLGGLGETNVGAGTGNTTLTESGTSGLASENGALNGGIAGENGALNGGVNDLSNGNSTASLGAIANVTNGTTASASSYVDMSLLESSEADLNAILVSVSEKRGIIMLYCTDLRAGTLSLSANDKLAITEYIAIIKETTSYLSSSSGLLTNHYNNIVEASSVENNQQLVNAKLIRATEVLKTRYAKLDSCLDALNAIIGVLRSYVGADYAGTAGKVDTTTSGNNAQNAIGGNTVNLNGTNSGINNGTNGIVNGGNYGGCNNCTNGTNNGANSAATGIINGTTGIANGNNFCGNSGCLNNGTSTTLPMITGNEGANGNCVCPTPNTNGGFANDGNTIINNNYPLSGTTSNNLGDASGNNANENYGITTLPIVGGDPVNVDNNIINNDLTAGTLGGENLTGEMGANVNYGFGNGLNNTPVVSEPLTGEYNNEVDTLNGFGNGGYGYSTNQGVNNGYLGGGASPTPITGEFVRPNELKSDSLVLSAATNNFEEPTFDPQIKVIPLTEPNKLQSREPLPNDSAALELKLPAPINPEGDILSPEANNGTPSNNEDLQRKPQPKPIINKPARQPETTVDEASQTQNELWQRPQNNAGFGFAELGKMAPQNLFPEYEDTNPLMVVPRRSN